MNILVTGGAGFIGSHVTELLCNKGHRVTVVDDLSFGFKKFVDARARFLLFSLAHVSRLEKALKGIDCVVHLAGSSIIQYSYERPLEYIENNITNGVRLLEAMRKQNVKKIIFSSTSSVYGEPRRVPVRESDPANPLNIYASSKLAFEQILNSYYHAYGIESVSLRYYNAYGPRDEQKPRTRAIPMWIEAVLQNKPVPWYWHGRQTRDYVYVTDIARAHDDVLSLSGLHIFNIGSGHGVVMKDVFKTLEKIVGKKLMTIDRGERKGDPMKSYADISKIKKEVDWKPTIALEEGLRKTYRYYQKNRMFL